MSTIRAVKGMNDILPEEMPRWRHLEERFRSLVDRYGFGEVRMPIVEPTPLFVRSIGETTDIVEKEMYTFTDRGDKSLTLRPEGTASAVRAYLEHNAAARQPVNKWYYIGPMYRRERPAKGRYRQFYQAGVEVFGDEGPFLDAEIIDMVVRFVQSLGIQQVDVLVNSLGGPSTREAYRAALLAFLEPHRGGLCADCQRRMESNPLRVLDCKVPADAAIAAGAPSILDHLSSEDRAHFDGLLATLESLGTPHRVAPRLVRGLDYYNRTLFEVVGTSDALGAQNALLGGGRYDGLVETLGGPATPAFGFAVGMERLLMAMPAEEPAAAFDAFLVAAQESLRGEVAVLARDLRLAGLRVETDLRGTSIKSQMRRADKLGARAVVIVGEAEQARGVAQLKDMAAQSQREVPQGELLEAIRAIVGA